MSDIRVELYYANWCPHCVNFKADWAKFKNAVDGKIKCRQYEESEHKELMMKKKIKGFPTLRIIVDNNIEEYNGDRDFNSLYNFVMNKINNLNNTNNQLHYNNNNNNDKNLPVTITLYHATWCGYCTRFLPTWERLKKAFNGKVNCEDYESTNKQVMQDNKITSFPTIKITYNNHTEKYEGSRDFDALFSYVMEKAGYSSEKIHDMMADMQYGGKRKNNKNFYNKYLKYKAKYLKLKKHQ